MDTRVAPKLTDAIVPLGGNARDHDALFAAIGDAPIVLIGEATHGTHEFYRIRAEITKRLIAEHGFAAVAIEGDWPDAYAVHRYVMAGDDGDAADALTGFQRFPSWMWRNADVLDFVGWLRSFNDGLPAWRKAGFLGLDLYSMYGSMRAVVSYLESVNPDAAFRARERYACFDRFGDDAQTYAREAGLGISEPCRAEALAQLLEMQRRSLAVSRLDSEQLEREFVAEQNAFVVVGAEEYYRRMLDADISSWNLRDRFMFETLVRLTHHLEKRRGQRARIVIWAHNSHVGDARATSMGAQREFNIGQLVRQSYPDETKLVGFSTSQGTVTAASGWGGEAERKTLQPPQPGSWEELFSSTGVAKFSLDLPAARARLPDLDTTLLQRAVGVVYLPQTELRSHYLRARLCAQFDTIVHFERTRAVEPLERTAQWLRGEAPETFPSGV